MSVEAGQLSRPHYNTISVWNDFITFVILDDVLMSSPGEAIPSDAHVATVIVPKIIRIVVGGYTGVALPALNLLPMQDPRAYNVADVALDARINVNAQVWRECLVYIQTYIQVLSSLAVELATVRAAMVVWFPTTADALVEMMEITETGVPIGDSYHNVRDALAFVTPEVFFQAAPTLAAKLSSIVDSTLWPAAERLWLMRSRADIVSLRVNGVISNVVWPYPANEIGHVGLSCSQQTQWTWFNGTYQPVVMPNYLVGPANFGAIFSAVAYPDITNAVIFTAPAPQTAPPAPPRGPNPLLAYGSNVGYMQPSQIPRELFRMTPVPGELLHVLTSRTTHLQGPGSIAAWEYSAPAYGGAVSKPLTTINFPDVPTCPQGENLRGIMAYLEAVFDLLAPLGIEQYIFTSGYALPVDPVFVSTYCQLQTQVHTRIKAAFRTFTSKSVRAELDNMVMPLVGTGLTHHHNLGFRSLMAVKSHLAQETSSDDLLAYDQSLTEYVRAPWKYWDQYVQSISAVADLLIEFGHDSDLRRAMTMMATHMYSLRGDVGQSVTIEQSFRPRLQAVLQEYVKESRNADPPSWTELRRRVAPILGPNSLLSIPPFQSSMEESIPGGGTGYQYSPMAFRSVSSASHELSHNNREVSLTANPSFILDTARNALVPQAMPNLGGMRMGYHRGTPVPPAYRQRGRSRSASRGRDDRDHRRRQPSMDREMLSGRDPSYYPVDARRRSSSHGRDDTRDHDSRRDYRRGSQRDDPRARSRSRSQSRGRDLGPPREPPSANAAQPLQCWRCGKAGHMSRDCTEPSQPARDSGVRANLAEANAAPPDFGYGRR